MHAASDGPPPTGLHYHGSIRLYWFDSCPQFAALFRTCPLPGVSVLSVSVRSIRFLDLLTACVPRALDANLPAPPCLGTKHAGHSRQRSRALPRRQRSPLPRRAVRLPAHSERE